MISQSSIRFIPGFVCLFLGAAMLALPLMTRRGILFAVPLPAGFRSSREGRRAIAEYHWLVVIALVVALAAIFLSPVNTLAAAIVTAPLLVLAASVAGFYRQRRKLTPFAIQPSTARVAELSGEPDKLPGFVWLGAGPFALLAAAAAFLHANWDRIPERFPVHWGIDGEPNRWNTRSAHGVYGPLIYAAVLCVFMLLMGLASWFGSRRSQMRRIVLGSMVATGYTLVFIFAGISMGPLEQIPVWWIVVVPLLFLAGVLIVAMRKFSRLNEPAEPTPNECWRGGVIYYNPGDPALFVEKRTGFGYTVNFGNQWSWALMAGLAVVMGSTTLLL